MPTGSRRATTFLAAAVVASLALFALLRAPWVEAHVVLPVTQIQKDAADFYGGAPAAPVAVTGECSGTDVLALCLAAILACPVPWPRRLAGAAGGVAVVLALNTVRIGSLGRAAASPALFETLHLRVWPAILVLATAGYVFAWMRAAMDGDAIDEGAARDGALAPLLRRFAPRAAVLLVAFALAGPAMARSETLLVAGAWIAGAAAALLRLLGLGAVAAGSVLTTSRGAFVVTPECLATALVPVYGAAVLAARRGWRWRILALLAGAPAFVALAIVRLLLLALPPVLAASPLFLVHGFHQLVLAVIAVALLASWQRDPASRDWIFRTGLALGAAVLLAVLAGPTLTRGMLAAAGAIAPLTPHALADLAAPGDAQGALALLPAYQAGLLLALGIAALAGWRRLLPAFGLLLVSQVALLVAVAQVAARAGLVPHALLLRAWAVGVPVLITLAMIHGGARRIAVLRPAADGPG
jgi:exosortase/archaeosortase family protein